MAFTDLTTFGLEFKHLISGPAPVGRILNYVIASGKGELFHKNGERTLKLFDYKIGGIGSAWCTEFMVGLGLCFYDNNVHGETKLNLTDDGKLLFNEIKNFHGTFNEDSNPDECKNELINYSSNAYNLFLDIFRKSVICKNLVEYIKRRSSKIFIYSSFCEEYFEFFQKYYTDQDYVANSNTATTANNRVPSLIQLCEFFGLCEKIDGDLIFNFDNLQSANIMAHYVDKDTLKKLAIEEEQEIKIIRIDNLVEKFGLNGEDLREVLIRNGSVQKIFRNNLIAFNGCECAICGKDLAEVLIASHIKPSCESNVEEKIDENNGLLLCANHDKLFDKYLISFNCKTGLIMYATKLAKHLEQYELTPDYCLPSKLLTKERADYMHLHNMKFQELNAI
jgi:hypothetical protein